MFPFCKCSFYNSNNIGIFVDVCHACGLLCFLYCQFDRALKKSELQMKVAEDSLAHVRSVYDKVKAQVDSAPRDDGTLLEKRKELQREVDVTKRTLAQQVSLCTKV